MNWIEYDNAKPPDCLSVLLYVVSLNKFKNKYSEDNSQIYIGYYSKDEKKYYTDNPNGSLGKEKFEIENNYTKVIAWTLPPRINKKLINLKKEFLKELNENIL